MAADRLALYTVAGDGTTSLTCELTTPAGSYTRPSWSPDGHTLTYSDSQGICNSQCPTTGLDMQPTPGAAHPRRVRCRLERSRSLARLADGRDREPRPSPDLRDRRPRVRCQDRPPARPRPACGSSAYQSACWQADAGWRSPSNHRPGRGSRSRSRAAHACAATQSLRSTAAAPRARSPCTAGSARASIASPSARPRVTAGPPQLARCVSGKTHPIPIVAATATAVATTQNAIPHRQH